MSQSLVYFPQDIFRHASLKEGEQLVFLIPNMISQQVTQLLHKGWFDGIKSLQFSVQLGDELPDFGMLLKRLPHFDAVRGDVLFRHRQDNLLFLPKVPLHVAFPEFDEVSGQGFDIASFGRRASKDQFSGLDQPVMVIA
jgi:hypothetical protein